jgi:hypothetical protein
MLMTFDAITMIVFTSICGLYNPLNKSFSNWWVASRFVVGREKFLKCDFFNYIKIKSHKKWESEKTKQN